MLEEIAEDSITSVDATNQPMFDTRIDYEQLVEKRTEVLQRWQAMNSEDRKAFDGKLLKFEESEGVADIKSPHFQPAKNLSLIAREVRTRISSENDLRLLPIEGIDFDESVLELAESLENVPDIRELYKLRKKTVGTSPKAGINTEEALRLKNCFSQGRELYIAGKNGSLMVKPLNFFYALTAYSYGIIVLNNPLRFSKGNLPGSHGMAYLPDTIQAQFGGDSARGTFSDLVTAFPTQIVKNKNLEINQDCTESLMCFYKKRFSVSPGTLLSMIPEMSEYYKLTTGANSRCFPLEIVNANDPRSLKWEFQIGDGETKPSPESIENAFAGFSTSERHGKIIVTVSATEAHKLKACIYTDLYGKFWYVENPFFPVILPEVSIHFLISNIFSSIMRYRPDEWGNVLTNDVSSGISLLTRHYFSTLQRKFFIVVLRSTSRYLPYVAPTS
jgi:hypothetical protein